MTPEDDDSAQIRNLVEGWAAAVRQKDIEGILRHHAEDIVMFDLPPPLESKGISAYEETWALFFNSSPEPPVFDVVNLRITAGNDVAFALALVRCVVVEDSVSTEFDFRLTIGFRKADEQWMFTHEHHSIPAA
jgi:uncharacterized protein (TIGR02246 family)